MRQMILLRKCKWRNGSQINQYIMAVMVTLPTMMMGMLLGWMSPMIPLLQDQNGPLKEPIQENLLSWLASATFLTAFPCMLFAGLVADTIGRKNTILISTFTLIICWLIKIKWKQSEYYILARAISGIGNAGCYVVPPLYINEISDDNIRGTLGSFIILAQNLGFLIMYVCGDLMTFTAVLWLSFILPTAHLILFLFLPDSPSYLVKKGKIEISIFIYKAYYGTLFFLRGPTRTWLVFDEASEVLSWLKSTDISDKRVLEDIVKLEAETEQNEANEQSTWKSLFTNSTTLKAFLISIITLTVQESCGYLILLTYASMVFEKAKAKAGLTPNQQAIVLGAVQFLGSIVACFLIDKLGRKPLLAITSFSTGLGMTILGTWLYLITSIQISMLAWIPIGAMCLSIFSTSAGFQSVPFVLMPELFNFKLRGIVSSIAVSISTMSDFVQTAAYQPLTNSIGVHGTFWMFAAICYFCTIFTLLFVPETKGKNLKEIYQNLNKNKFCFCK